MGKRNPSYHIAAIVEVRHLGVGLVVEGFRIDQELAAHRVSAGVIALGVNPVAGAVLQVRVPGNDEAAVAQPRDGRASLIVGGLGADLELTAHRAAAGVVHLPVDARAAAVLAVGFPGDNEAAACQGANDGLGLIVARRRVDQELTADGIPAAIEPLAVDPEIAAILVVGLPDDHIAAPRKPYRGGVVLVAGCCGVDLDFRRAGGEIGAGLAAKTVYDVVIGGGVDRFIASGAELDREVFGVGVGIRVRDLDRDCVGRGGREVVGAGVLKIENIPIAKTGISASDNEVLITITIEICESRPGTVPYICVTEGVAHGGGKTRGCARACVFEIVNVSVIAADKGIEIAVVVHIHKDRSYKLTAICCESKRIADGRGETWACIGTDVFDEAHASNAAHLGAHECIQVSVVVYVDKSGSGVVIEVRETERIVDEGSETWARAIAGVFEVGRITDRVADERIEIAVIVDINNGWDRISADVSKTKWVDDTCGKARGGRRADVLVVI